MSTNTIVEWEEFFFNDDDLPEPVMFDLENGCVSANDLDEELNSFYDELIRAEAALAIHCVGEGNIVCDLFPVRVVN